jgi:trimeric autotransporter adhesin
VAEVSIANTNGAVLARYMRGERDRERLAVARARYQRYAGVRSNSSSGSGSGSSASTVALDSSDISASNVHVSAQNDASFWETFCMSASAAAERTVQRRQAAALAAAVVQARIEKRERSATARSSAALLQERARMEACCGAFVVFNNRESQQLCLSAYAGSTSALRRWLQPRELRFCRDPAAVAAAAATAAASAAAAAAAAGGVRAPASKAATAAAAQLEFALTVEQAPSPSNIIWENVHYSDVQRELRTAAVQTVTLLMLAASSTALYFLFVKVPKFSNNFFSGGSGAGTVAKAGDNSAYITNAAQVSYCCCTHCDSLTVMLGLAEVALITVVLRSGSSVTV